MDLTKPTINSLVLPESVASVTFPKHRVTTVYAGSQDLPHHQGLHGTASSTNDIDIYVIPTNPALIISGVSLELGHSCCMNIGDAVKLAEGDLEKVLPRDFPGKKSHDRPAQVGDMLLVTRQHYQAARDGKRIGESVFGYRLLEGDVASSLTPTFNYIGRPLTGERATVIPARITWKQ